MNRRTPALVVVFCLTLGACSAEATVSQQQSAPTTIRTEAVDNGSAGSLRTAGSQGSVGSEVEVAIEVDVELIEVVTTTLVAGTGTGAQAQDLFGSRIEGESIFVESIEHMATVQSKNGPIEIFHYDQDGWFCAAVLGEGIAHDGCTSNDQMSFGTAFLRRPSERASGDFHVWVSNADDDAAFFVVETDTGSRFVSNVVSGTGYAITDDGSVPIEARLTSAAGELLWSEEVRT